MLRFQNPFSLRQNMLLLGAVAVVAGWLIANLNLLLSVQFLFLALCIAAVCGLLWLSSRPFFDELSALVGLLEQSEERGDWFESHADTVDRDLIGLSRALQGLLRSMAEREAALMATQNELELRVSEVAISNTELNAALRRLRAAQEQMESSERMASLGSLVAGVAHEINTPVGIGVTAASSMQTLVQTVSDKYERGELGHRELCGLFDSAEQYCQLLMSNLKRAAELVHSFKQVAVNQTADDLSHFDLQAYTEEVWCSLSPQLKGTSLSYALECKGDMVVRGYAGAISQILTNLVMNSLMHGYASGVAGTLSLSLQRRGDMVCMRYCDDGDGVAPEHLDSVFDPFFTTKRGAGGSGLGMYIVYNLATQRLQGEITLQSEPSQGLCVELIFPADLGGEKPLVDSSRDVVE